MASENNDISDIIKKCKILLLDIEGTTTSISFVKDKLFPYAEANVKEFLDKQWEEENVKEVVAALRKLALEDEEKKTEGVVTIPGEDVGKEEQIEGLVKNVQWQMSVDRKVGPLKQLQGLIWKQGYEKGDIKGHVYDDVLPALQQWLATEGQKVYIYSSGSVQAQKLLFGQSVAGDLMPMIEGYFDTAVGAKQEPASYIAIVEKIGCKPEDVLFLSDIVKEAEAARTSGLHAALVIREGNAPIPTEAAGAFPVIHSFDQLTVSNKRKPEPQEEELPAKVPKTDEEADVKTASEEEAAETKPVTPISTDETTVSKDVEESEKMEVEDIPAVDNSTEKVDNVPEKTEEAPVRIETIVEEITNNDVADTPVSDIAPVVEESMEKTEKNETEQMDTDSSECVKDETVVEPKEPVKEHIVTRTVAEETPNGVTIEDVTNDHPDTDIIEDLVPVVEEPMTVEMEDLQNVGEVLEKECDEILSKVQDVTNLDNIPVKPLLNSIAEESMDAENGENTNDIVESILASEMEFGVDTVQETPSTKSEATDDKQVTKESTVKTDEKQTDDVEESISTETVTEEVKNDEINVATEANKADVQDAIEKKMEVASTELETKSVSETKEITVESTKNKLDQSEESAKEKVENVAETNGSVEDAVENKLEAKDKNKEEVKPVAKEVIHDSAPKQVEPESVLEKDTEKLSDELPDKKTETESTTTESNSETDSKIETENKMETDTSKQEENKIESNGTNSVDGNGMVSEESVPQESKIEEITALPEAPVSTTPETVTESKENASEDVQMENDEKKLNGDAKEVNINGVASKVDELSARLSVENVENGKEMNGANGNGEALPIEMGQGDNKVEMEIPDIKVKTVTDEPRSDPIEQPTEA